MNYNAKSLAVSNGDGTVNEIKLNSGNTTRYFGICNTAATTNAKVLNLEDGFELVDGVCISIRFVYGIQHRSVDAITLNVNGIGDYVISCNGVDPLDIVLPNGLTSIQILEQGSILTVYWDASQHMWVTGGVVEESYSSFIANQAVEIFDGFAIKKLRSLSDPIPSSGGIYYVSRKFSGYMPVANHTFITTVFDDYDLISEGNSQWRLIATDLFTGTRYVGSSSIDSSQSDPFNHSITWSQL